MTASPEFRSIRQISSVAKLSSADFTISEVLTVSSTALSDIPLFISREVRLHANAESIRALLPLPIPASIYGIMLLFAALALKIIPVSAVKDVSTFLLEIMPMLFIPAAAGLLEAWGILKPNLAAYIVITLVATVAVMVVSGLVTQFFVRKGKKNG